VSFQYRTEHDEESYWPGDGPIDLTDLLTLGSPFTRGMASLVPAINHVSAEPEWRMEMYQSGHLAICHIDDKNDGTITVAWSDDFESLKKAFVFCKMGYDRDRDMTWRWQNGTPYIFNWVTGTLYQIGLTRRILGLFLAGRVNEAWDVGKMAEDLVRMAEENERQGGGAMISHDDPRYVTRQGHIKHLTECPAYDPPYNDDSAECRCNDVSPEWTDD